MGHDSKIESLGNQCSLRNLWVGIGCKRGTPKTVIEQAIASVFQAHALSEEAIAGIATIDTKANEVGLVTFCRDRQLPLRLFSADVLRSIAIPTPSSAIDTLVGTPSVAEAAALLACMCTPHTPHRSAERSRRSPTPHLHVSKQTIATEGQPASVTIAVARSLIPNAPDIRKS